MIDADKFYGTTPPAATPAPLSTIATGGTASAPETPPVSTADLFYGSTEAATSTYASGLRDQMEVLASHMGAGPDDRAQMEANASELFADARIQPDEAIALHTMFVQHVKAPADEVTRNAWSAETLSELHAQYGESADARLAIAKKFVAERPELAELLATTGLGNHPKVVLALVSRSGELRFRGPKK